MGDPGLRVAGVIIEDHSDIVADAGGVGRDWALPGRWAIALVDGFLVVRNTTNLRSTEAAWLTRSGLNATAAQWIQASHRGCASTVLALHRNKMIRD